MPRFVLLHHQCPPSFGKPSHWDLMLEREGALLTWSLPSLPSAWRASPRHEDGVEAKEETLLATRLPDHRLAYLDYEGPVSGDRGVVVRHDGGEYELIAESDEMLRVRLRGDRLDAIVTLERQESNGDNYRFALNRPPQE